VRLRVRYFAWLRERVGAAEEEVETDAATVAELVEELRARDEAHALAFADLRAVRVAVDEELAEPGAALRGVREVAFFPPMTGG
jgi:molybdopterin synthase sulfur carrier subunit